MYGLMLTLPLPLPLPFLVLISICIRISPALVFTPPFDSNVHAPPAVSAAPSLPFPIISTGFFFPATAFREPFFWVFFAQSLALQKNQRKREREKKKKEKKKKKTGKMVRGKTQMKRIENATSRQVTFSKRRNGLLKKAFELSVLCDAEIALIIFSPRGKLYEFNTTSMQETIARYQRHTKDFQTHDMPAGQDMQQLEHETSTLKKKTEMLEAARRKFLGEDIGSCSIEELQQLESQLELGVGRIRAQKNQVYHNQIQQLKEKIQEKLQVAEHAKLSGKKQNDLQLQPQKISNQQIAHVVSDDNSKEPEVVTDLFIGLPETNRALGQPPAEYLNW
ncbi:hypothetical protein Nepgr_023529 [Nepenthes gracilis]|uniref:Uncharacterized protein n=1 Tax=Nepenthes gracilis TaxID=150966 RepID=A0AAD3XXT2_NEPGR|nr:hypothetical protein Nepgr_023529 [Nepenthes gracilis]